MLSTVSGHHFAGHWDRGIVPPFIYPIDPALVYLNVPASNSTDLPTKFVNRGSATPLQTSNLAGVNLFNGPPAYVVNVLGYASLPPSPTQTNLPPVYTVDSTNLPSLIPTTGVYTSLSYWVRAPSIPSSTVIYLPSILDGWSNSSAGFGISLKSDLTATGKGYLSVQHRSVTTATIFSGAYSTFLPGVWRHVVCSVTYGGGPCYVFVNGVQYSTWASPGGTAASAGPYYLSVAFGTPSFGNTAPLHWNDLRVEDNKMYTAATAATAFNARRAYYGV